MQRVLELLETRDSVHVAELADEFSVFAVTVRHDLSELARQGLVARVRGGVRGLQRGQSELAFDVRLHLQSPEKRAIAIAAAAMVGDGESVGLDSSTTAYYLALEFRKKREIVVVTNGLLNAVALADSPGVNVLVTGGIFRLPAMSVVGDPAGDVLRGTRIDKGFLGVRGISVDRGLMDFTPRRFRSSGRWRLPARASSRSSTARSGTGARCSVRSFRSGRRNRHRQRGTDRAGAGMARAWRRRDHGGARFRRPVPGASSWAASTGRRRVERARCPFTSERVT